MPWGDLRTLLWYSSPTGSLGPDSSLPECGGKAQMSSEASEVVYRNLYVSLAHSSAHYVDKTHTLSPT